MLWEPDAKIKAALTTVPLVPPQATNPPYLAALQAIHPAPAALLELPKLPVTPRSRLPRGTVHPALSGS